jgi:hypothetical protein
MAANSITYRPVETSRPVAPTVSRVRTIRPAPRVVNNAEPIVTVTPVEGKAMGQPIGAQSVIAAGDGQAQYIPVPIMTQPPITRMPQPPQAPNPVAPKQPAPDQWTNAFTPPPSNQPPMPMPTYGGYPRGMPMPYPGNGPQMGYGPMNQQANFNRMMPPGMYPQNAMGPQMPSGFVPPQMSGYFPGRGMMPTGYYGPMQPIPNAPMNAQPSMPAVQIDQHISTLKNALYPSHREMAVIYLSGCSAQHCPQVVGALVMAAKDDPAATVRAAAVSGLVKMGANTPEVVVVLTHLRNDNDPRVRQEVDQALARMMPGQASDQSGVQPAHSMQR